VCSKPFQHCEGVSHCTDKVYAVALHSLYDIPADEFGAALLRRNVHVCYAAFHFSENLLLEDSYVSLDDIGAFFSREGDMLNFSFVAESTLNYTHSYSNVLKYVCKTYFPASSREVYMKEFLVTRVNTWFCKFSRLDTFVLYRGVYHRGVDKEQFYSAMEDAWHYKKTLAMMNSERILLEDSSSVNYWFPKMKDMVIVPLFDVSLQNEGKRLARKEVMVSKDFVYTVLNHIRTYQSKALTYANVLSFVESIRSRVIINGVTARSEWDVDKALLQSLSMTFFLQTKLAMLKDDLVVQKFQVHSKSLTEYVWDEITAAFHNCFPTIKERLINKKLITVSEKALEIKVPDLYVTFHDRLVKEYKSSVEMPVLDVKKSLEEAEVMYNALSEISILKDSDKFDVDVFSRMCNTLGVDPLVAAKVMVAVVSNESGLTLTFERPTEANVALALQPTITSKEEGSLKIVSSDVGESSIKEVVRKSEISMLGLTGNTVSDEFQRSTEIESLQQFHMVSTETIIRKQMHAMVYTGPLKVQQCKNYLDSLVASLSAAVSNLKKIIKDTAAIDLETKEKFGVYDVCLKKWLVKPQSKGHAWGVVMDSDYKCFVALLTYDGENIVCGETWRRVAVSSESLVYSDMGKIRAIRSVLKDGEPHISSAKVTLVDGVPGCGKTKEILSRVNFDEDLVLVPGKQAAEMIRRRANSSGLIVATKENVRTVDSFLMNYGRGPCQYKRLFLDEGLMLHPGCVNFLVGMSLCSEAFVYGDTQQIPYINRVATFPYPKHLSQLEVDAVETRRTTLRCPADITFFLNQKYEGQVMCTSSVTRSVSHEVIQGAAVMNPVSKPLKGKVITFTQSDKSLLLSRGYEDVHTVHEVQGETFEDVSLVRLTPTPVGIISKQSPHLLVSLSRHTRSIKYYTVVLDAVVSVLRDLECVSSYLLDMYKVDVSTQ